MLVYVCTTVGIEFVEKDIGSDFEEESFCFVGELEDESIQRKVITTECVRLVDIYKQ